MHCGAASETGCNAPNLESTCVDPPLLDLVCVKNACPYMGVVRNQHCQLGV